MLEGGEILQQVSRGSPGREPGLQISVIGGRQPGCPADGIGELEHGLDAEPAVEMVVKERLRGRPDRLAGDRGPDH